MFKEIINRIFFLLSVPKCVKCGEKLNYADRCLCEKCRREYEEQKERNCSRCARKLSECECSSLYLSSHYVKRLIKVFRYSSTAKDIAGNHLIYSLKQDNREDVFDLLSDELVGALNNSLNINDETKDKYIITYVPRRQGAIREYGYDHSKELAKRVARKLEIKYISLLRSRAKTPQKGTQGSQRFANVNFVYKRCANCNLNGITVILIDDIVTTGASMSACASLIRGLGTRKIIGASVSIAYKDKYTPFVNDKWK